MEKPFCKSLDYINNVTPSELREFIAECYETIDQLAAERDELSEKVDTLTAELEKQKGLVDMYRDSYTRVNNQLESLKSLIAAIHQVINK